MSRLQDVIARGTLAAQPLATAVPIGELYCITDQGFQVQQSDGTNWLAFAGNSATSVTTVTTTGNIDNLDFSNASVLRMNNATASTIRGLKAGVDGQELTIISVGAGQVNLNHQDTNSTAANRLINFVTSGLTPLAAGVGTVRLRYDLTTARWRLVEHNQGDYIAVPFSAGNFTASGSMTWTVAGGSQLEYAFFIKDRQITVNLDIQNSTTGGTPDLLLQTTLPNSYTISSALTANNCRVQFGGSLASGGLLFVASGTSTTKILTYKDGTGTSNWANGSNNVGIFGFVTFPIN